MASSAGSKGAVAGKRMLAVTGSTQDNEQQRSANKCFAPLDVGSRIPSSVSLSDKHFAKGGVITSTLGTVVRDPGSLVNCQCVLGLERGYL